MSTDIKAVVAELERLKSAYQSTDLFPSFVAFNNALLAACEGMLAELRRLWAIEEAAVRYREELRKWDSWMNHGLRQQSWRARELACMTLFAALPPRKEGA